MFYQNIEIFELSNKIVQTIKIIITEMPAVSCGFFGGDRLRQTHVRTVTKLDGTPAGDYRQGLTLNAEQSLINWLMYYPRHWNLEMWIRSLHYHI